MTTLAANAPVKEIQGKLGAIGIIASDTVYEGAMVGENAAGYGRPLVSGDRFVGHAVSKVANEAGAAGALNITLRTGRYRLVVPLVAVITDVGQPVYASDDAAFTMIGASGSFVGVVTRYVSTTEMEVEFRVGEFDEWGANAARDLKTDNYTTDVEDSGKIIYLGTDAKTVTLIATVAGIEITIVNPAEAGTVLMHVDPNADDNFLGGIDQAAGGNGKKLSNTKTTQNRNDYLKLLADGAGGWNIVGKRGTWAMES